ncbi:MAG: hypothetical protein WC934_12585 [Acidithiobacillus sp.]|jgi:hypothetical protein|uniref:hypothetical protein n=1 Tax=Acidithiobacillus sp. TaxID=1872118 RepID=UPI003560F44A
MNKLLNYISHFVVVGQKQKLNNFSELIEQIFDCSPKLLCYMLKDNKIYVWIKNYEKSKTIFDNSVLEKLLGVGGTILSFKWYLKKNGAHDFKNNKIYAKFNENNKMKHQSSLNALIRNMKKNYSGLSTKILESMLSNNVDDITLNVIQEILESRKKSSSNTYFKISKLITSDIAKTAIYSPANAMNNFKKVYTKNYSLFSKYCDMNILENAIAQIDSNKFFKLLDDSIYAGKFIHDDISKIFSAIEITNTAIKKFPKNKIQDAEKLFYGDSHIYDLKKADDALHAILICYIIDGLKYDGMTINSINRFVLYIENQVWTSNSLDDIITFIIKNELK